MTVRQILQAKQKIWLPQLKENRGNISELGLGTELKIKGTIENVPCIVDGEESTKTVEYDTYFVCVAVDFLRTTKASSEKRSYTFMPFGSPIGTNVIDNATGLGDVHAYSQTFIQQKVMPVYTAHFKIFLEIILLNFQTHYHL